jgi:hypothetical protein
MTIIDASFDACAAIDTPITAENPVESDEGIF